MQGTAILTVTGTYCCTVIECGVWSVADLFGLVSHSRCTYSSSKNLSVQSEDKKNTQTLTVTTESERVADLY